MTEGGERKALGALLRAASAIRTTGGAHGLLEASLGRCFEELTGVPPTIRLLSGLPGEGVPGALQQRLSGDQTPGALAVGRDGDFGLLLGGALRSGDFFAVDLRFAVPPPDLSDDEYLLLAAAVRAALLCGAGADDATRLGALGDMLGLMERATAAVAARFEQTLQSLRTDSQLVATLRDVGQRLTAQLDLDRLVQEATDAATAATTAHFGAFFYNLVDEFGGSYTLYTLSGVPPEAFEGFPMPRSTEVFAPTFTGMGTVRSDDILADPRYGRNEPFHGMPPGHLPARSYLAVPVISPTSHEVLGGFFFGHPETGRFTVEHERLAEGLAGYTAIALDNARLYARERSVATDLQRRMLPASVGASGFSVVTRYLPAAEVGGDWLDVVELASGRTAFIIGDVMGKGIPAASTMGQIRTAMRAYALLDLPPQEILRHTSQLAVEVPGQHFITCIYAIHDPAEQTLTYANAGHPAPAVISPDGEIGFLEDGLGMPLRLGGVFEERVIGFPSRSAILLYTDGLVERRDRSLTEGIAELEAALRKLASPSLDPVEVCDQIITSLTCDSHDDDVAVLFAREAGVPRDVVVMPLTADPHTAAQGRRFVSDALARWGLKELNPAAEMVATELIANAVRHSRRPHSLRLQYTPGRLLVEVADGDGRRPQRFQPTVDEVNHRGLFIVDELSEHWGSRLTPNGKVVWAQLAVSAESSS
jgi:Stage II sporulation protein E (SpoIIE)/GAF domain/Histidine kinase-like ATPase domain